MIIDLLSPSGIVHGVEMHAGRWYGHENILWGIAIGHSGGEILNAVLLAVQGGKAELPFGFTRVERK